MPEYRIVTKIDPQTAPGAAKTKQDLQGVKTAADSMNRSIESGTPRAMGAAAKGTTDFGKAVDNTNRGMARAKGLYSELGLSVKDLTDRVMTGSQKMQEFGRAAGGAGAGGGGGGGGGAAGGVSLLRGAATVAAGFIGGAFAIAVAAGASALVDMAIKAIKGKDDIDDLVKKLREDAQATDLAAQAKEAYGRTLDGVRAAIKVHQEALDKLIEGEKTVAEQTRDGLRQQALRIDGHIRETEALIAKAEATIQLAEAQRLQGTDREQRLAGFVVGQAAQSGLEDLRKRLAGIRSESEQAWTSYERALGITVAENAARLADPLEKIREKYGDSTSGLIGAATAMATAEEVRNGTLTRQITLLKQKQKAEEDAYRASQRAAPSDGVQRFRSRAQAIGMAGRELQGMGLRVDGNSQFGYTSGHSNDADHNKNAIDVNVGKGVVEADLPDVRARFEQLARSYQRRGYNAIFDGKYYPAFGNGPSGPAKGHRDHLHLYAPETIVGKPTGASTAAQEARDYKSEQQIAARAADFVDRVVDNAATVGLPDNNVTRLETKIKSTLEDFRRQFDREANTAERAQIVGALTEADARDQAERFRVAYQYPLEDLQLTLGQTGMQREIQNRILDETARKGEALTDVEVMMIENSVRMTDKYQRMDEILTGLNEPLEQYRATISALNSLLAEGSITQERYNAEVANLQSGARSLLGGVDGVDPNTGVSFADQQAKLEEDARYQNQLASFQLYRQQLLDMGVNYDALVEAAHRNHIAKLNAMDMARHSLALNSAQSTAESLASIAEMAAGKQSAVYKAMFIAAKAFAIADAIIKIQQGIANALALPYPANIAAIASVAAAAASIVSNIQAVALNLADGGMVRGPGGPRDDRIPANLSDGEFVVNAAATSRNRALLEAINNGGVVHRQKVANDNLRSAEAVGGDSYQMHFGDVIVQAGNATAADSKEIGREVKTAITSIVRDEIAKESRPGGRMTRTRQSVLG